jgi:hypothetical protein
MQCSIVGFLERRSKYSAPNSVKGWELMSRFWWPDAMGAAANSFSTFMELAGGNYGEREGVFT